MKKANDGGPIWNAWTSGGALAGKKARPHGRVTVEPGYYLNTANKAGAYPWLPVRWYQRADNSQYEVEIPGVLSIEHEYSIDQDGATFTIKIANTKMDPFGTIALPSSDMGNPGYLTFDRGTQTNRWGFTPNEWQGVLGINALIRTYEGYGGDPTASIASNVASGNLVLTGVWLVDEVDIQAGGDLTLKGRNMAKLVIDQQVFPGLVPTSQYPISWTADGITEVIDPVVIYGSATYTTYGVKSTGKYITGIECDSTGDGYWLVGTDGGVFCYGNLHFWGCPVGIIPSGDVCIGIARTVDDVGYWICTAGGRVYAYGDAVYFGNANLPTFHFAVAIERCGATNSYWIFSGFGEVYTFGSAQYYGGSPSLISGDSIVAAASTPTGLGYWMCDNHGYIYSYGDAQYYGGVNGAATNITGMAATPTGKGYYIVGADGGVFCYGDAQFYGSIPNTTTSAVTFADGIVNYGSNQISTASAEFQASDVGSPITGIGIPPGSSIVTYIDPQNVKIGPNATASGNPVNLTIQRGAHQVVLNDPVTDICVAPNDNGYWLGAEDGGVFTYGKTIRAQTGQNILAINFYGSLPGTFTFFYPGNYSDFTDIVVAFLLWSGFYFYDNGFTSTVYGNIESTGTHSTDILTADIFDKKPVIDAIKQIRDIVGYVFYIGDEGEAHFHEPNYWASGNPLPDGTRTTFVPTVDERTQLTAYTRSNPDKDIRSQVIISSEDPAPDTGGGAPLGTVTSTFTTPQVGLLKGMVRPAMWINKAFINQAECDIMAQLIALHIFFKSQLGTVTMLANPMIQIDDQVQILERESFEVNYHYVRRIRSLMNLQTGEYTMDLTTNILSPSTAPSWQVQKPTGTPGTGYVNGNRLAIVHVGPSSSGPSAITNGGFETGNLTGWTVSSGVAVVVGGAQTHTGQWALQLGSTTPTTIDAVISQSFTAPTNATLSFWYKSVSTDTVHYDWVTASLYDNTAGINYVMLPNTLLTTWTQASHTVTAGHNYTLTITNHDDNAGADPTFTLIDDVTLA